MAAYIDADTAWSYCPCCGGATAEPMGVLGDNIWWRCQYCGSDYTDTDTCDCKED
jgi:hypothetical protein